MNKVGLSALNFWKFFPSIDASDCCIGLGFVPIFRGFGCTEAAFNPSLRFMRAKPLRR